MDSLALNSSNSYRVVANGQLQDGFSIEDVQAGFAQLFNVQVQQAKAIVGTKRVIKKDLTLAKAEAYQQKLEAIGLVVQVEGSTPPAPNLSLVPISNEKKSPNNSETQSSRQPQAVRSDAELAQPRSTSILSLQPIAEKSAPTSHDSAAPQIDEKTENKPSIFACPKCHLQQERSAECIGCGIIFSKYRAPQMQTETASTLSGSQSEKIAASTERPDADESTADIVINEQELNPKSLIAAAVAALGGALIWLAIALTTGYEIGYVAWGIGGAIGFAAALFGAKGQKAGIACGLLALTSIVLGQYLVFNNLGLGSGFGSDFEDEELEYMYEYLVEEAPIYFEEVHDSESLMQFMREYGYADYYLDEETVDEEIEYFNSNTVPEFKYIVDNNPSYEQWKTRYIENMENSADEYVAPSFMSSFDFKSLLFLFLGIGTAYQLGFRGPKQKE